MPDFTPTLLQLTREQRANLRTVPCQAVFEAVEDLAALRPAEQVVMAAVREASGPPMLTNGKPTVARVLAWMAHEGVNRNRQGFVKEELAAAAPKIGFPDAPLVMDFDHSAIRRPEGAQRMVGVWHKADFAFDAKANEGKGAWGLLVQGVFFSWLFPEIANTLLADQARAGQVDFSMACIASSVELGRDAAGPYEILHNPAFFTNSLLDVPPADKDARGMLVEGSDDPELEQRLMTKLCSAEVLETRVRELVAAALHREEPMPNELKDLKLELAQSEPKDNQVTVTATVTLADGSSETACTVVVVETDDDDDDEDMQAQKAALDAANAKVTDLETALEAAKAEQERLTQELADLVAMTEVMRTKVQQFEVSEQEKAAKEKLAARLAELPEAYRAKHVAKAEDARTALETRWAAKSDEEWAEFVALLAEVVPAPAPLNMASYRARTAIEGTLVVPPSTNTAAGNTISERVNKILHS